eukprot:TRINITY_DN91654_c0_g1_i3.p1 TRINITY_DN91654_c0_g1~~TRINITY_DN91654_c0_g1_i3.p1  ORF type:complete len:427 (+),score=27.32 TRINITY_DN91654_c0_g1_i3:14-1294(+)
MDWKYKQDFPPDADESTDEMVTSLAFDSTGDFLAAGDRGGKIAVYKRDKSKKTTDYSLWGSFQSHEPEFDYLKSLEIEEKINKIQWYRSSNGAQFLLSTNDKTIKLWKACEKSSRSFGAAKKSPDSLSVPTVKKGEPVFTAIPRRVFSNAHAYHINSVSINSDLETFMSSDDLRINLWNLSVTNQSFNIVDIKPANMEELTEVITCAEFHPTSCHVFMYSSSKGTIKLSDMRSAALCDSSAKMFEEPEDPTSKSFFSEIISSISDIQFTKDGRYILSRDYLTLKLWDVNMERKPIKTLHIHDYLRSKLCDLYENDCIFDKFECSLTQDSNQIITGSYNNCFYVYDMKASTEHRIDVASLKKGKPPIVSEVSKTGVVRRKPINPELLDYNQKILQAEWHPKENLAAVGCGTRFYIFEGASKEPKKTT